MLATPAISVESKTAVAEAVPALEILTNFFRVLNQSGVRYCHWKSNIRLAQALGGRTDVDLLVHREDSDLFRRIVSQHKIKPAMAAPGKHYPAIENYLGFDAATGEMFHLHVHYNLVLGEQYVKNYRLPLEEQFLASVRLRDGVMVPSLELELIVLSMRALLKYRDRDGLKDLILGRGSGIPKKIRNEVRWLLQQTSMACLQEALQTVAAVVPSDVVLEFLQIFSGKSSVRTKFWQLRGRLRTALRPYQRYGRLQAMHIYYQALWRQDKLLARLRSGPKCKMTLFNGGTTIAVIGSDGAGKSTVIQHIKTWLSWRLTVRTYYMGSSQPSFGTSVVKRISKMAQMGSKGCERFLGSKNFVTNGAQSIARLLTSFRFLAEAKDRQKRYRAGQREAACGSIIIYDRLPFAAVRIHGRAMDGPRIVEHYGEEMTPFIRKLAQREESIYQQILPAECMLVLHVSLAVALARKPDHKRATMEAKNLAIQQIARDGHNLTEVNTDQPLDVVLSEVKSALWDLL